MKILILMLCLLLMACSSTPSKPAKPMPVPAEKMEKEEEADASIDAIGLQRELKMDYSLQNLGYREKSFDTCRAGYGYSRSNNCRIRYMAVINFRLMCRDSEGTVSKIISEKDMFALGHRKVKWTLSNQQGSLDLDSEGYGQILALQSKSPARGRLRLTVDNDFLFIQANEAKRIVTPKNWCNQ